MEKFKITVKLNCNAKEVFKGWLDNKMHAEFTGGAKAKINAKEGGEFTVYDGYIKKSCRNGEPLSSIRMMMTQS